jgi:hypothetical protein
MSRLCMTYVILCFAVVLLVTVSLRTVNDRIFYRLCVLDAEQNRLKQQLWQRQLALENQISPAAVSERLGY